MRGPTLVVLLLLLPVALAPTASAASLTVTPEDTVKRIQTVTVVADAWQATALPTEAQGTGSEYVPPTPGMVTVGVEWCHPNTNAGLTTQSNARGCDPVAIIPLKKACGIKCKVKTWCPKCPIAAPSPVQHYGFVVEPKAKSGDTYVVTMYYQEKEGQGTKSIAETLYVEGDQYPNVGKMREKFLYMKAVAALRRGAFFDGVIRIGDCKTGPC